MQKLLGSALKHEREMRGISLPEIAREMNISQRYLAALENEDFGQISGDFYVRQYIRSYLRAAGADETDFFNRYNDYLSGLLKNRDSSPAHLYFDKIRFAKFRKRRFVVALFGLALFLAAAVLLVYRLGWQQKIGALLQPSRPALQMPVAAMAVRAPGAESEPDFPALRVDIVSSGSSWIRARRGADVIAERMLRAGESLRLEGYELSLFIANPAVVGLRLNGRPYVPAVAGAGPLRLNLTPADVPAAPSAHE